MESPTIQKAQTKKNCYKLNGFVSSAFTNRLNHVHKVMEEIISPKIKEQTESVDKYKHCYSVDWIRLDQTPYVYPTVQQNVFDGIKQSHMVIADISVKKKYKVPNPSVMHEIGFATALGIPVFLIGQKGTNDKLPANLKGSLVSEYETKELKEVVDNGFTKNLSETILKSIKDDRRIMPPRDFQVTGYRLRRKADLPYLIRNARYRVHILTTNLEYISTRLCASIEYALERNITNGVNRSFKVDLLTMDPESVVTNARAKQLSIDVATYRNRLRNSLKEMQDFAADYSPANVEIGTYVTLPSLIMFLIDDLVVWSVPFPSQQSRLVGHFACVDDAVTTQQFLSLFYSVKSQTENQTLL